MSGWGAVTWDIARAGGFTAYILLTLSVALGLALTIRWQSARWPRLVNSELHNFFTLLSLIFVGIHVLAVLIDPFTSFGLAEVFIPLVSHYRPLWMALGIVGLYLGLAIGLSTWLRPIIGYRWWRRLHVLSLVLYALVTVHGIATGSDTRTWWGVLLYAGSVFLVGGLLLLRLLEPATAQGRRHPVWAGLTAAAVVFGGFWMLSGPLQPGWNTVANNGQGSGARVALAAGANGSAAFTLPFSVEVQGTMTQSGPDSSGVVTYDLVGTFQSGTTGRVEVRLTGQEDDSGFGGGVNITQTTVSLGTSASPSLYTGQVTNLRAFGDRWRIDAQLNPAGTGAGVAIALSLRLAGDNSFQGTIAAQSTGGTAPTGPSTPTVGTV